MGSSCSWGHTILPRGCCRSDDGGSVVGLRGTPSLRRNRAMAEEIHAEIVANVLKVMVKEGQVVDAGDTVVLLESMKMEIPVLTETAGTLTKIAVKEGDVVQEHDLIAVVE